MIGDEEYLDEMSQEHQIHRLRDNGKSLWPIVIHHSRYQGVYEGGKWFALANCDLIPEDAVGDDCDCLDFFMSDAGKMAGIGKTPNEALSSLVWKHFCVYVLGLEPGENTIS